MTDRLFVKSNFPDAWVEMKHLLNSYVFLWKVKSKVKPHFLGTGSNARKAWANARKRIKNGDFKNFIS